MRTLLVLIAALMATIACATNSFTEYDQQLERYNTWAEICVYGPYSCEGVLPPKVDYVNTLGTSYGRYEGNGTVLINDNIDYAQRVSTLYHEMIHYLQVEVGGATIPDYPVFICPMEEEAFAEGDKRWDRVGRPDMKRGPNWWYSYRHCYEYYDPNWTPPMWNWIFYSMW